MDDCKNCGQWRELVPDTPFCKDCYADMDDDDYDDNIWLPCGCHYSSCTCEGNDPVNMGREDDGYYG